jgi:4,5:9,10-diseco-3-hydroxy-5,9,17-trioxoandrosta-1(10),2-diene-4-oate hydrolase
MSAVVDCGPWQVSYGVFGKGDSLILLHGGAPATSGEGSYAKNIVELARHYKVYVIDFPGWGGSSLRLMPEGRFANPMEVGAEVVAAFMKALGISKAHVLGSSFGGAVALHLALEHPALVDRLVLCAPAGGDSNGVVSPGLGKLLTYYDANGPTAEKFADLMRHMVHDPQLLSEEMLSSRFELSRAPERIQNFPLRLPPEGRRVPIAPLSSHQSLPGVTSPVLFVWGRNDEVQPIEALASFYRLPDQRATVIDKCGHWPYWEYPERFNEAVVEFLYSSRQIS